MAYTKQETNFANDAQLKLIVEPHYFSISVSGEILRKTSFSGCVAEVSCYGEVIFYSNEGNIIGKADKTEDTYKEVRIIWRQGLITIDFGYIAVVDYYPNCDGEYDHFGKEWVTKRSVTLSLINNSVEAE